MWKIIAQYQPELLNNVIWAICAGRVGWWFYGLEVSQRREVLKDRKELRESRDKGRTFLVAM